MTTNWISVKDRLPDTEGEYLCVTLKPIASGQYSMVERVLQLDDFRNWVCSGIIVTHWMPLPELPEGEIVI